MQKVDLPDDARIILVMYEDGAWSLRLVENCAAVATSERAAAECIATLVDEGAATEAEALALCVQLARACELADPSVDAH